MICIFSVELVDTDFDAAEKGEDEVDEESVEKAKASQSGETKNATQDAVDHSPEKSAVLGLHESREGCYDIGVGTGHS